MHFDEEQWLNYILRYYDEYCVLPIPMTTCVPFCAPLCFFCLLLLFIVYYYYYYYFYYFYLVSDDLLNEYFLFNNLIIDRNRLKELFKIKLKKTNNNNKIQHQRT